MNEKQANGGAVLIQYLTLPQFAEAIGKSRRTVQRWLDEGLIRSDTKLPGATGAHLFRVERVNGFPDPERAA